MRIACVTTGLDYGGAETQLVNLALRLKARNHDVHVISMISPRAYVDQLTSHGIPVASLHMKKGVPDPRAILKLASILKKWQADIVHSHMVAANLLTRLSRMAYWVPVCISTAHTTLIGSQVRTWMYRMTDPLCDVTTAVSEAVAGTYVKLRVVPESKIIVVPNGIEVDRYKFSYEWRVKKRQELELGDRFVWLAVGRLEKEKDYPTLLTAFKLVTREYPDALLLIVGQGSLKEQLECLIVDLELKDNVRLLGIRDDIPELMSAADAYVMSSIREGLPLVLLEASACSLPIVATDVGGNREVVYHLENGILTQAGSPGALAGSMLQMHGLTSQQRRAMGRKGRYIVETRFDLSRVVDLWEELYSKLLQKK